MSLIYVTGAPGTGKSTIQRELTRRGYEAYDVDDPQFGGPVNKATGESTTVPPIGQRSEKWFEEHEWRLSRPAIVDLKARSEGKIAYLCGTATTENLVWDVFDKVLYLNVDEETLRSRISSREDNDFGKTEHELELILDRHRSAQENLSNLDVTIIDATKPVNEVVDDIVALAKVANE